MLLEGVFAPVTTPFYADERVYFRKIEANMARYSRSLLAGMVVLGSTGEAVSLNDEETRDVLRVSAEATAPEKVLIAGIGRESVHATLELAEFAATLHYDAVLVRPPSYYTDQISPAAILHYFRSIADRSPLPRGAVLHSQIRPLRDAGRAHCRACSAPEHHRHQGLERQRGTDSRDCCVPPKTRPGAPFRSHRFLRPLLRG